MTTFLPRSAWTSSSNGRAGRPLSSSRVVGLALHYPAAGPVSYAAYTRDSVARLLQGWRNLHRSAPRHWADIGYNFAVDGSGRVWDLTGYNVGAHAGTTGNPTRVGVLLVLGDNEEPTEAMVQAIRDLRERTLQSFPRATRIEGHRQVPGNSTACPGSPVMRLIDSGRLLDDEPSEAPADVDVLDSSNYPPHGYAEGAHVQWIGERLVAHGFDAAYSYGPTPSWGEADRENVAAFQRAQGWTGSGADGYPGPLTLLRLAAEPAPKRPTVTSEFLNMAGYNGVTKPGVRRWKKNTDGTAKRVLERLPDVFNVVELSNKAVNRMRPRLEAALRGEYVRVNGGSDGRYNVRRTRTTEWVKSGVFETPNTKTHRFKGDDKQAAWTVYRHEGRLAMDVSCHAENEAGADYVRVSQALYFLDEALKVARSLGVPEENVALFGDFNSQAWVARAFENRGWKVAASANFVGWDGRSRKRFNLAVVKAGVEASGSEVSSAGFSDHNGLTLTRELV